MELANRLPFCPRCRYSFTGLPETHQCPECGLPYDAESWMWTASHQDRLKGRSMVLSVGTANLFSGVILVPRVAFQFNGVLRLVLIFLGLLNVVGAFVSMRRWWRYADRPLSLIAIMPDGMWLTVRNDRIRSIGWKEMISAKVETTGSFGNAIRLHLFRGRRVLAPAGFMSSPQIHDAISRIMARVAKTNAGNSISPPD